MNTLTTKSEAGSVFIYELINNEVVINATSPAGQSRQFKTFVNSKMIEDDKIRVWHEGSDLRIPCFEKEKVRAWLKDCENSLQGRKLVQFKSYDERNEYAENHKIGKSWIEEGVITAYEYL